MSAFTLGADHIDLLVTTAIRMAGNGPEYAAVGDALGLDLLRENFRSVNYRYSEEEPVPEYRWTPVAEVQVGELTKEHLLQIIMAVHCYEYQSCEHPEWEDSRAFQIMHTIELWASAQLVAMGVEKTVRYHGGPPEFAGLGQAHWVWSREDGFGVKEEA
jgi:hypothetical protein